MEIQYNERTGRYEVWADKGMRITRDGINYLKGSSLPVGKYPEGYYEITETEYQQIMAMRKMEQEMSL